MDLRIRQRISSNLTFSDRNHDIARKQPTITGKGEVIAMRHNNEAPIIIKRQQVN
jgi:hypothetical protein